MLTLMKKKILIVGGGTAGWMAANLLAKELKATEFQITLLESPEIGIIGVGEGSTPQLKSLFDSLDIAEADWMAECDATYKLGISFKDWSSAPGFSEYFHPFPATTDRHTAQAYVYNCYLRRQGVDVETLPDNYFLPAFLAQHKRGPVPDSNFPFPVSYGYHFNAYLLGEFLKNHGVSLGVEHLQAKVVGIERNQAGDIASVSTQDGHSYHADFFIDATGFSSLLLQQTLGVSFKSFGNNLFNDSAVVLPSDAKEQPNSYTTSSAMKYGWGWDIPLRSRTGNGYVYSSDFCNRETAETELREKLGLLDSPIEARHLKMRVGQVEQHWSRNCLAVGLSQGFIEPLEATALHLVQSTIERFIPFLKGNQLDHASQKEFNTDISNRFEGIRDYIVCHYKLNSCSDTPYWRANANNPAISDSLQKLIRTWSSGGDLAHEIEHQGISKYYPVISWHCLFSGYGTYQQFDKLIQNDVRARRFNTGDVIEFNIRCASNFKDHASQLPK